MWFNDYNKRKIGFGGDLMLRYGIARALSVGLLTGYEELKSDQDPPLNGVTYLKLQAIPTSAVGWIHFAPDKPFNPYLYFGVGAMLYKRTTGGNVGATQGQFVTSILVPVGVGFETFTSKNVSIAVDLGYRILDGYTDGLGGKLNSYATAKVGVNFYFGTSAAEKEELARAEGQRIKDSTDAAAQRAKELADAEAQRMKALAEAEARRIKDSTEAEARRLAELNARRAADTVIVLEKGKTVILKGVNFEFNKATLTKESETILERAFNALVASPDLNVLIVGHTDNVGSAAYNKKLSLRRAESVRSWLVKKGISAKRLTVGGKGFDEPIDDNTTAEGRANNRRMEFRVLK
jgi:outer membrane protein OmpA-like peptidoglycan-associated protein